MGYLLPLLVAALALGARAAPTKSSSDLADSPSSSSHHASPSHHASASHSAKASASTTASDSDEDSSSHSSGKPTGSSSASTPEKSGSDSDNNIQELVAAGILAAVNGTGGLDGNTFYALDGWRALNIDDKTDENEFNQIVFEASDGVPSRNGSEGAEISFSQQFVNYVQDMNSAMIDASNETPQDNTKLNDLANKQGEACLDVLAGGILDEAIHRYQLEKFMQAFLHISFPTNGTKKDNKRDTQGNADNSDDDTLSKWQNPEFIEWAQGQKNYSKPITECLEADAAYQKEYDKVFGNNFNLVSATSEHIRPLAEGSTDAAPGINMKIADADESIFPGALQGQYAPQYTIPVLKGTLKTWTDPKDNKTTPDFQWSSNNASNAGAGGGSGDPNVKDSKDGGGKRRRFSVARRRVVPANTSQEDTDKMKQTFKAESLLKTSALRFGTLQPKIGVSLPVPRANGTAESFQLSFKRVMRMDIQLGNWFDMYRTANAIRQANDSDPITNAAKPVLKEYFGTKEKPGNAAFYNLQALVVFQPAWKYSLKTSEAALELNGSLRADTTVKDNNVIFNDTSANAYIVGYVQTPFWK